jgi:hypothetical protein
MRSRSGAPLIWLTILFDIRIAAVVKAAQLVIEN